MKNYKFVLIDDDAISNRLCKLNMRIYNKDIEVVDFTSPEEGLRYLSSQIREDHSSFVLLLDINMPTMSGWEFLASFEKIVESIEFRIIIYMLSSSVDPRDQERAYSYKSVQGYLEKPLKLENLVAIGDSLPG